MDPSATPCRRRQARGVGAAWAQLPEKGRWATRCGVRGTFGGTSTTDNVSYQHLLNIKHQERYPPQLRSWLEAALPFKKDMPLSHRLALAVWQQGRHRVIRRFKQA